MALAGGTARPFRAFIAFVVGVALLVGFVGIPSGTSAAPAAATAKKKAKKKATCSKKKAKKKAKKHATHSKAKKKKAKKRAKCKRAKKKAIAPAAVPTCTPVAGAPGSALDAFIAHLKAAHLETGLAQQLTDIGNLDEYIRLHTVLIGAMADVGLNALTELPTAAQESIAAFLVHFYAAHLERSPGGQVTDAIDTDEYVRIHTVLVEAMGKPLADWAMKALAGACVNSGAPSPTTPPMVHPGAAAVEIKGNAYAPADLTVAPGSTVTWTNGDDVPHTVTSTQGSELSSSNLNKGGTYSHTFSAAGVFAYFCAVHPTMKATVTVK